MYTRRAKLAWWLSKFKSFLTTFRHSRRGPIGISFIIFFIFLAIVGPLLTPHDPLAPSWPGNFPATPPRLAFRCSVPIWYKMLPGGGDLSENMEAIPGYQFSSNPFDKGWTWDTDNHTLVNVTYNPVAGLGDGCIEVSYKRGATDTSVSNETYAKIDYSFTYPFGNPPTLFKIHKSCFITGTISTDCDVRIVISFYRKGIVTRELPYIDWFEVTEYEPAPGNFTTAKNYASITSVRVTYPGGGVERLRETEQYETYPGTNKINIKVQLPLHTEIYVEGWTKYEYPSKLITYDDSLIKYEYPLVEYKFTQPGASWESLWITSTDPPIFQDVKYYLRPDSVIFPERGNYTLTIKVFFNDQGIGQEKDVKVFFDNINVLFYGEAFGLLGTDGQGRDILTGLLHGARISVQVGLLSATISVFLGLTLGLIAGYVGGLIDEAVMRIADFLIIIPFLPLLIVLSLILRPSIWNIILLISIMGWMGFSRNIRSITLSLRERAFVEAAKAAGAGKLYIIFNHIVPNVIAFVYLAFAFSVPGAIISEASLSFLGLFDPTIMSWGRMFHEFERSGVATTKSFSRYWFWVLPPGISISLLAVSFIFVGYALDEIFNPKLRKRL